MKTLSLWRVSEWLSIFFYGILVIEMLRLWFSPGPDDVARILTLSVLITFEFVLVHSGLFMAMLPKRFSLVLLIPFYSLFAIVLNFAVPGNAVLLLYLIVIFVRVRFAFSNPTREEKIKTLIVSASATCLYLILVTIFAGGASFIPDFGLSQEYLISNDYFNQTDASGLFIEKPHIAIALGSFYFTLLALLEIKVYGLLKPRTRLE
jgi:hypothetical protein